MGGSQTSTCGTVKHNSLKMLNLRDNLCLLVVLVMVGGCSKEPPPPPSVDEFLDNRILLDAAMARCTMNRSATKYEAECVNAREASNRIAREEEAERRRQLEAQSERKRAALRRTQRAADEARRRSAEADRARREAEYLSLFEGGDPPAQVDAAAIPGGSAPVTGSSSAVDAATESQPASPAVAPVASESAPPVPAPAEEPTSGSATATDLDAIRERLKERTDGT